MRVVDAHRVLGPIPTGYAPQTCAEAMDDLDALGIDAGAVVPAWCLQGDPLEAADHESHRTVEAWPDRMFRIPVVIPGIGNSGWPASIEDVLDARMVRICPQRHRFDLLSPLALEWWRTLADVGVPVSIDANECSLSDISELSTQVPRLRILVLTPGYRELRRLAAFMMQVPSLWIETGTMIAAGALEWMAQTIGAERMVFGTGAPYWDDAGPRFQLDHLELSETEVALIAAGSWERLTMEGR